MTYARLKRLMDITASLGLLTLSSPVLLLIGVVIKIDSAGPVFFRQQRAGRDGRPFAIYKFRSMYVASSLTPGQDPSEAQRVTRAGGSLRRWALDELPQLYNILVGDMSFVGPRPTLLEQVARYDSRQWQRLSVRPGLTGLAQVSGRNTLTWEQRIELDLRYVTDMSWKFDAAVLLRTLPTLLAKDQVYGPGGRNHPFS